MNKEKRQKRFLQKERNLHKWTKRIEQRVHWEGRNILDEDDEKIAHIYANHGKLCSCHMCGNPRKHWNEKTIQERKHEEMYGDRYSL